MKVVPPEGATITLPELAGLARGEAIIQTRAGKPLVSVRDVSRSGELPR
jgi:hypothetical protein